MRANLQQRLEKVSLKRVSILVVNTSAWALLTPNKLGVNHAS